MINNKINALFLIENKPQILKINKNLFHSSSSLNSGRIPEYFFELRDRILTSETPIVTDDELVRLDGLTPPGVKAPGETAGGRHFVGSPREVIVSMVKYFTMIVDIRVNNDVKDDINDVFTNGGTSFSDSFPWLLDDNKAIDYNKSISLFDGVKLMSKYLTSRLGADDSNVNNEMFEDMLEKFKSESNGNSSVLDFYDFVSRMYKNNKAYFDKIQETIIPDKDIEATDEYKPIGEAGDITVNNLILKIMRLQVPITLNNVVYGINAVPAASFLIGYGLILRTYMKVVYNREYNKQMGMGIRKFKYLQNRNLLLFSIFGAPAILYAAKMGGLKGKDLYSIDIPLDKVTIGSSVNPLKDENVSTSGLFLMVKKLKDNLPNWLKYLSYSIMSVLVLSKLFFGYNPIEFILHPYYLKFYIYFVGLLAILIQILDIYLIFKFKNNDVNIPEYLPDFMVEWLSVYKEASTTKEGIDYVKNSAYLHIFIFSLILILLKLFIF